MSEIWYIGTGTYYIKVSTLHKKGNLKLKIFKAQFNKNTTSYFIQFGYVQSKGKRSAIH